MNSDRGFRAARKAGARGTGRLVFPVVFLGLAALLALQFSSGDGSEASALFVVVTAVVAVAGLVWLAVEVARLASNRGIWGRAARGAVSLTLRGEAVAKQRNVSGRPMRTVVVEHGGGRQYLHLLFAKDAPVGTMRKGPVTVELFAGDDVGGPARILLPDGRTLWAFTSRLGARPPVDDRRTSIRRATGTTTDASSAAIVGGHGLHDGDPDRDGFGDGAGESSWSGGDGWTGGGSWGGDPTWSGSDGGGWSGSDTGGGGWSGGGWSGGDSGGGGGDSGGGGGS